MKIKIKILVVCLFLICVLKAEEWRAFTNTNFINDITGDSSFLYCATYGGFTVFSRMEAKFTDTYTNIDGLSTNRISCLMSDKFGKIWIGTYRGVAIYDPVTKEIQKYDRFSEITQNIISCLVRAGDTVLVGTQNGLYIVNTKGTVSFTDDIIIIPNFPISCSPEIFSIKAFDDFWISACPGLVRLNRNLQTYTTYIHPFGDSVKAMTVVNDTLIIASERGLARFDGTAFIPILNFPENRIVFDLEYADDKFFIATNGGLIRYDWYNSSYILSEDSRKVFVSDGLWVGVGGQIWFGGGLRHYTNSIWQSYKSQGLTSNNVSCAISDKEGSVYAMHYPTQTYNFKTISYKKLNENWQNLFDTLIDNYIAVIDKENDIWFGHWSLNSGLSHFDPQNNEWQVKVWNGYRGVIGALGIDNNDTKWTYNQYNTIIALNDSGAEVEFSIPGLSRPEQGGYEFAFDSKNRVWLGSSGGLVMIDYKNTLFNLSDDSYRIIPFQEITSLAVDCQDNIWCATAAGIARMESTELIILDTTKVKRVKCDAWGNVWFLGVTALTKYNIYTHEWKSFTDENSGVIPNIDNDDKFYRWLFVDNQKGFLLIATKEGISQFYYKEVIPESLSQVRIYPNPFITSEHQVITFDGLPQNALISIYTIEGKFITELTVNNNFGGVRWQPKSLKSGIFLAVVKAGVKSQIAKFAVIR